MSVLHTALILILSAVITNGDPNCTMYGGGTVVCTPGDSDYVLQRGLVSDNNKTTSITFRGCRITEVDKGAFNDLLSLKYLDLSQNSISSISLEHFGDFKGDVSLPELIHLNISFNQLVTFHPSILSATVNLQVLDLRGNKLTAFDVAAAVIVEKLQYLDISDNGFLSNIIQPILSMNSNIRHLDISKNNLANEATDAKCLLMYAKQLEVLHLDKCDMLNVPNVRCSNLGTIKHLTLSTNRIDKIQTHNFNDLFSLQILDLSGNTIANIEDNAFKSNVNLKTINLSHNKLKVISEQVFQGLPRLANLDLAYNLIEDVPVNAFRETPLRNFNLAGNRFTYLQDNFCIELKNSRASLRKFYFNQNPWQCACLKDILAEVKKYEIDYNDAKYNGKEPVCGVGERFICERHQSENDRYTEIYNRAIDQFKLNNRPH